MAIEVRIAGLALDERSKAPIIVLKDKSGKKVLPIVIGIVEASAIAAELEGVDFPRPMTHDLLANAIEKLGGRLERIEVSDLINDTFYAVLYIRKGRAKKLLTIDARPSDSIALALRTNATIMVDERVFEKISRQPQPRGEGERRDALTEVLETMDDDDFGKYKM